MGSPEMLSALYYDHAFPVYNFFPTVLITPVAYYNRGNVYRMKKEYNLAIADYTQAIAMDPTHVLA